MTTTRPGTLPLKSLIATAIALAAGSALAQTAGEAELARRLDQLAAELAAVKAQLAQMQQQPAPVAAPAAPGSFGTTTPVPGAATAPASPPYSASLLGPGTVITSYGEINYNRPTRAHENTQIDLRRFVLGYQHRFDEKTQVVTELEVEHAVTSADDPGEVAVEQAYVEHRVAPAWAVRAGLMLMPVGLINENHDPIAFYGVERNFVETAIIPSTWREGGLQVIGTFDNGLTVQKAKSRRSARSTRSSRSPRAAILPSSAR
jgi:hypothetical protein